MNIEIKYIEDLAGALASTILGIPQERYAATRNNTLGLLVDAAALIEAAGGYMPDELWVVCDDIEGHTIPMSLAG